MKKYIIAIIITLNSIFSYSQETTGVPSHPDQNFVVANVLIISDGEELASSLGHAALQLSCATHSLDYVFDVAQIDDVTDIYRFVKGEMKTRVRITPSNEYFEKYTKEDRSITKYTLNLPIATKQRLWQIMDNHVAEEPKSLTRMHESCAGRVFGWLNEAAGDSLEISYWPQLFNRSVYEMETIAHERNWKTFIFGSLAHGIISDSQIENRKKIATPWTLEEALKTTKAYGAPIISNSEKIEPSNIVDRNSWFSPMTVAIIILILSILNLRFNCIHVTYAVLAVSLLFGLIITFLVSISNVDFITFSWLLIPFSPLPWIFYKYRRYWFGPMSKICLVWCIAMLAMEHQTVLNSHIVLALATAAAYAQLMNRIYHYDEDEEFDE